MTDGVFLDVKGTLPLKGENEGISSVMTGFSSEACLWKTITFFHYDFLRVTRKINLDQFCGTINSKEANINRLLNLV